MQTSNMIYPVFFRIACLFSALFFTAMMTTAVAAESLTDLALSSEQDELVSSGKPVRLYGIHFPIEQGICNDRVNGCREVGLKALADWIGGSDGVECDVLHVTSAGNRIARCRNHDTDLGAWLVGNGYAVADRRSGRSYVRDQQAARKDRVGLWSDGNQMVLHTD